MYYIIIIVAVLAVSVLSRQIIVGWKHKTPVDIPAFYIRDYKKCLAPLLKFYSPAGKMHMLEASEKIAEISGGIARNSDCVLSVVCRCEIAMIKDSVCDMLTLASRMLEAGENDLSALVETGENNKDFIEHLIAVHSKTMAVSDFDDGSCAYEYLRLLYYFHVLVGSFCNEIKYMDKSSKTVLIA